FRMQEAIISFLNNFPHRLIANSLMRLIFPLGRKYASPKAQITHTISDSMLSPSPSRDSLTSINDACITRRDNIGRVDYALMMMIQVEPHLKRLDQAVKQGKIPHHLDLNAKIKIAVQEKILNESDAKLLQAFEEARLDAIHVDEFVSTQ